MSREDFLVANSKLGQPNDILAMQNVKTVPYINALLGTLIT